jgi:outer membrane protein
MIRLCSISIMAIAFLSAALAFAQQEPLASNAPPVLTLQHAIELAESGNRDLAASTFDIKKATEFLAETRTNYLPKLQTLMLGGIPLQDFSFTIPAGILGTYPGTGPIPAKTSDISTGRQMTGIIFASAQQPLTQLYKVHLASKESRVGVELAKESVRGKRQDVIHQVKQIYYQVSSAQTQLQSAQAGLAYLQQLDKEMDRNLSEKAILPSDSLTVKSKIKQQEYLVASAQDAFDLQKEALNRLLGRSLDTAFAVEVDPTPSFEEIDLESARKHAVTMRPEVNLAKLQNKKAELEVSREKAESIPDIGLSTHYLSFQNISFLPTNAATAGLMMQWQPYDWGYKRHRREELRSAARQTALQASDVEQQVLLDVDQKFRELKRSRLLLGARQSAVEAEREKLRELNNRYLQKAALLSEVLSQQASLTQAESQYHQALGDFWTAKANFEHALGED